MSQKSNAFQVSYYTQYAAEIYLWNNFRWFCTTATLSTNGKGYLLFVAQHLKGWHIVQSAKYDTINKARSFDNNEMKFNFGPLSGIIFDNAK